MVSTIRALGKTFGFFAVTLTFLFCLWIGYAFLFISRYSAEAWRIKIVRSWARAICHMLGMKIHVTGTPPKPPFFLVSNHLSYIDIILFFSLSDCIFVAKSEVSNWPFIGYLAKTAGTLFINRKQYRDIPRVNHLIREVIGVHQGVLLFPEGTSSAGEEILPFKPSLLQLPAEDNLEVCCAAIQYAAPGGYPDAATSICWWGDMTFADHLWRLFKFPGFEARISFSDKTARGKNRKSIAGKAEEIVKYEFQKIN